MTDAPPAAVPPAVRTLAAGWHRAECWLAMAAFACVAALLMFDVLGREVAVLADESLGAGGYVWHWQADGFASGKYFVRLDTGHESRTTPLILLK